MFNLEATPYSLDDAAAEEVTARLREIEKRIVTLRNIGTLTTDTLKKYYGEKRFEQVAESNAIEGSTLSAGETELAVMKGVTITGHDPAYVRDAIALDKALTKVSELARFGTSATNIEQLRSIHELILGDRPGGGIFRSERVSIRGAAHVPPRTIQEVMTQMEHWQSWSEANASLPAPIRSAVLHAWLTHVHPYIDGNGRVSRATGNLELIRAGYPPIIIKKKERERYIEALAESDDGGDLRSFVDLIFTRIEGALTGLENSAKQKQGFNPLLERINRLREQQLTIWNTSIKLLASMIELIASQMLEPANGNCSVRIFEGDLDLEDYLELCAGRPVSGGWAFIVGISVPGLPKLEKLAYVGHRSVRMRQELHDEGGPSLYWSRKNLSGFPKWTRDGDASPYAVELTSMLGRGDDWVVRFAGDKFKKLTSTELASSVASALIKQLDSA
jgi:Fic family protein